MRGRGPAAVQFVAALALVWLPFLPAADPWTGRIVPDVRVPALAAALVSVIAVAALFGRRLGRARWPLAALLLAAAVLQLAAAMVEALLERPLDLYFDVPQLPALAGLLSQAAGPALAAGAFLIAGAAAVALCAGLVWALGSIERALAGRRRATALVLAACAAAAASGERGLSFAASDAVADQGARLAKAAAVMSGFDHRYDAALASPDVRGDLAALAGRDVFLVFVESYGTVLYDDPRFRAAAAPIVAAFTDAIERSGYAVRSSRLVSPVFGGGSWLAHGTIESGLKLDPFLDRLLVGSRRTTLARDLAAAGHRTVAVMPGIKKPWPEASFWGFGETMFAKDLAYDGPAFGWFAIPDQYTLETFRARALGPGHAPLFAEIVLVSSHAPFAPVPPFIVDWRGAQSYAGRVPRAAADWSELQRPYLDSIAYDLKTLAHWLDTLPGDGLVIILGDHQPPGVASGASAPWTVPVHVLSRNPALVAPFVRLGYEEGMEPPPAADEKGMEGFLRDFLRLFSTPGTP